MHRHHLFESIEGLPGTGKSTIAPLLARARQAVLVPTVPPFYQPLRRELDTSDNVNARMCFFLSALFTAVDQIRRYLDAGIPVVVESYFARCLTTHRVYGADIDVILPRNLPQPVIYQLVCEPHERRKRMAARAKPTTRWDTLGEQNADRLADAYLQFPIHQIETTGRRPDQIVQMILDLNAIGADHAYR
ncbi:AAA family ATPase [Nocardia sp. XZ_19_369]|uniref:AAA family ATPase n=1 Tax=Nocardia sp. XZ_19_369 TaxID=2769487 RepID=UPI001890B190|nr:AAA family ATPase [Nocardia sp. XZ_19_369]